MRDAAPLRRRPAARALGPSLLASLVAAVAYQASKPEFADLLVALPLVVLDGIVCGAHWAVLAYYFVGRAALALVLRADPEHGVLFALAVWPAARRHVDAGWRALWMPPRSPGGSAG